MATEGWLVRESARDWLVSSSILLQLSRSQEREVEILSARTNDSAGAKPSPDLEKRD